MRQVHLLLLASILGVFPGFGSSPAPRIRQIQRAVTSRPLLRNLSTKTPILTYHDIIQTRNKGALWFDCTLGEFEAQIAWFEGRGAHFVSLDQVYDHLTRGTPLPPKALALTFADNYLGFYQRALPVLRKHKIPVTMFVHTDFVGSPVGRPKMNWAQLKNLARGGDLVTVASQTCSHPADLRTLDAAALDREMTRSKAVLEQRLGKTVRFIAYPNGKFDKRSEEAAKRAGYLMGFSEVTKPAEYSPSIMAVNRYVHTKFRQAWTDCYR